MPLVSTEAIVLHIFDYSETSRILRLATREVGVVSVLARGARRAKSRFGSALDLFAQGVAQLYLKDGRDLQTMSAFDATRARPALGSDLGRFASASVVAELALRFGTGDAGPELFAALAHALDRVAGSSAEQAGEAGLAGAWQLVAAFGFTPSLDACSACHTPVSAAAALAFNHRAGGVLCASCAPRYPAGRTIPGSARAVLAAWSNGQRIPHLEETQLRAHQRLLREFLEEHLTDGRVLHALDAWEHGGWSRR